MRYKTKNSLTDEQEKEILEKYEDFTSTELATYYNVTPRHIVYIWSKNNKHGKRKTKYKCDFNYFENIDSKDKAYFLGLIASDGSITFHKQQQKAMKIALQIEDVDILKLFKEYLKFEKPITIHNNKNHRTQCGLEIISDKMADDLSKYNIINRKTYSYTPVILPKFMNHFMRGYFDGDGTIHIKKPIHYLSNYNIGVMCGFEKNVIIFKNFLSKIGIETSFIKYNRKFTNNEIFGDLRVINMTTKYCFLKYIYDDCDNLCLLRKKKLANEFIKKVELSTDEKCLYAVEYYNKIKVNF